MNILNLCDGIGSTLIAAASLNRRAYGFEIKKEFVQKFNTILKSQIQGKLFNF